MSLNIAEAIVAYVNATANKVKKCTTSIFVKACFAGMFIGMGAAGSNVAAHNIGNVGVARLIAGGLLFSLLIVLSNQLHYSSGL